jgi:hypothetical protein
MGQPVNFEQAIAAGNDFHPKFMKRFNESFTIPGCKA